MTGDVSGCPVCKKSHKVELLPPEPGFKYKYICNDEEVNKINDKKKT